MILKYYLLNLILADFLCWLFIGKLEWLKFGGVMAAGLSSGIVMGLMSNYIDELKSNTNDSTNN